MLKWTLCLLAACLTGALAAQITDPVATEVWEPEPRKVTAKAAAPPSDAIVLFDGSHTKEWVHVSDGRTLEWETAGDALTVKAGTGDIKTRRTFGDFQLHLEFRTPAVIEGEGQGRGNSGVFLQERYEVQILDSYDNRTYSNGQAGAVYKQSIPLVNASRPPGEWQTYDIIYTAPVFNADGIVVRPAYVTVLHNGVVIQHHTRIDGPVEYIGLPKYVAHGKASIKLQDHGNPVSFRNIWVREM